MIDDPSMLPTRAGAVPSPHELPLRFSGSGSEYFRIWIVNLLLTLVTLGLYLPWAKVRRLRYFYGNTLVGDDPLDFHGDPKRMLRGYLLVGALLALYSIARHLSEVAGLIALALVAGVWPALFRAGQQFRLANTSWRGLRFRFLGGMGDAYRTMLPLFVPALLVFGAFAVAGVDRENPTPAQGALIGLVSLASVLLLPLATWLVKRYQHGGYALGQEQTTLRTGAGSFYVLFLKTFGVFVGIIVVMGLVAALLIPVLASGGGHRSKAAVVFVAFVGILAGYGLALVVMRPFIASRMQNLLWNRTASPALQFESALRFRSLLGLTLKNWLLVVLTLGFYWPFAAIAMTRLRLEAVTVRSTLAPDALTSPARQRADDATGDAAGDLFGIDIGL